MRIIVSGTVSSSFQLIGAIAARNKMADKYHAAVYLRIRYHQYWNRDNISREILDIIEKEFSRSIEIEPTKIINLSINNPKILIKNQIIIDDGIAAYRKNPLALLKAINNEKRLKNEDPHSIMESIKYTIVQSSKMLYSMLHPGHISIFEKRPWNYFAPHEENKKYFLKAIEQISDRLNTSRSPEKNKIILFLSQPHNLFGFQKSKDYEDFVKKILAHFKEEDPEAIFVIKRHPMDSFDYSNIEAQTSCDDGLPAELYFYHNKENILKIVGFNSTSLLTGKILFDIPGFYIEEHDDFSITSDFWVNRGFKKHLNPLRLSR